MAISLQTIEQTKHAAPPRIIIHGREKTGKSTFFAGGRVRLGDGTEYNLKSAPNPIFVRTEDGLTGIEAQAFPLAKSYQDVIEAITALAVEDHQYQTVVIDSADWLERLIHEKICTDDNVKSIELAGGGYGKGYGLALYLWREILSGLDYLNREKKMTIGIICHSNVVQFSDPNSEPYDRFEMKLHQPKKGTGARDLLLEWADVVGFANHKIFVTDKKTIDGKKIANAVQKKGLNSLALVGEPGYVAGNRFGLPGTIDLAWDAFEAEMTAAYAAGDETNE